MHTQLTHNHRRHIEHENMISHLDSASTQCARWLLADAPAYRRTSLEAEPPSPHAFLTDLRKFMWYVSVPRDGFTPWYEFRAAGGVCALVTRSSAETQDRHHGALCEQWSERASGGSTGIRAARRTSSRFESLVGRTSNRECVGTDLGRCSLVMGAGG